MTNEQHKRYNGHEQSTESEMRRGQQISDCHNPLLRFVPDVLGRVPKAAVQDLELRKYTDHKVTNASRETGYASLMPTSGCPACRPQVVSRVPPTAPAPPLSRNPFGETPRSYALRLKWQPRSIDTTDDTPC